MLFNEPFESSLSIGRMRIGSGGVSDSAKTCKLVPHKKYVLSSKPTIIFFIF
ncbi:hypothetical protein CMALT394_170195 [Carnobacterium maltaromaticum]|nr:hypothetical protein CMALT394_170195 [Carnobacterium maltaromaticum]